MKNTPRRIDVARNPRGIDVAILTRMNERPRRRPLVPRWLIISVIAALVIVILAIAGVVLTLRSGLIAVPALTGRSGIEAHAVLENADLKMIDGGQRFSVTVPRGSVISQEPTAGSLVRRGDVVTVIVSAGSESQSMPDVVGLAIQKAQSQLQLLGFRVTVETIEASATEGTVMESYPAAGFEVRSGTNVRLSVAGRSLSSSALLPYKMDGITVLLDPTPVSNGTDVTLEVSRRLQALLEASGAQVVVTRSATTTATSSGDRAAVARETTANVAVVLDLALSGPGGLQATLSSSTNPSATALAAAITEAVRTPSQVVIAPGTSANPTLAATTAPGVRVVLGNPRAADDTAHFADPAWADTVARAIYRALGTGFGR
ncbi:MAG: PASTA domain-containing protein [Actinomycetota bacterium]|nr:PASTA domain-containing protein [Actinomycetota bacterium]